MKQRMVLVISVVVGLLAFWMTKQYLQARLDSIEKLRQELYEGARMVDVLAAGRELPAGTLLAKTDLKRKPSLEREIGRNTILPEDVEMILGKKLKTSLSRGETLQWSYVDVPYRPGSGLAPAISPNMRAVSIAIGGAAAVSGLVQPNDRVDVLGSFFFPSKVNPAEMEAVTFTLLQDVTVLATGQTLARQSTEAGDRGGTRAGGYNTVTFEVTPREAELLVFAEGMKGHLTLTLRNPTDLSFESSLPEVNFSRLEKELSDLNVYRQQVIRHKAK
jgi:pilus assembly protein CpaB